MNRVISLTIVASMLMANTAFADCDFSKGVTKNQDGTYTYTKDCHVEVGKTVKKLAIKEEQVQKLEKVIELKDLALVKQHERTELWRTTTYDLQDRVTTIERMNDTNKLLWFGLGILVTVGAGFAVGQAAR